MSFHTYQENKNELATIQRSAQSGGSWLQRQHGGHPPCLLPPAGLHASVGVHRACCAIYPSVTRLISTSILILGTIVSSIVMTDGTQTQLKKLPGFCEGEFQIKILDTKAEKDCDVLVSFQAFKVSDQLCSGRIFFFAFFLLMLKAKTSKDPRAAVHNGLWFFKSAALIGIMDGSFYIPGGHFTKVWISAGMLGATFFIFIQLVLLVAVAHSRNE